MCNLFAEPRSLWILRTWMCFQELLVKVVLSESECKCVSDGSVVDHRHANTAAFSRTLMDCRDFWENIFWQWIIYSPCFIWNLPHQLGVYQTFGHTDTLTRITIDTCLLAGWLWYLTSTWRCDRDFLPAGTRCVSVISVSLTVSVRCFVSDSSFFSFFQMINYRCTESQDVTDPNRAVTCKPVAPSHTFSLAQSPYRHLRLLRTRKHPAATINKQEALLLTGFPPCVCPLRIILGFPGWFWSAVTLPVTDINI